MLGRFYRNNPGDDRLSHAVARGVPCALEGLTSMFGMGTGLGLILFDRLESDFDTLSDFWIASGMWRR